MPFDFTKHLPHRLIIDLFWPIAEMKVFGIEGIASATPARRDCRGGQGCRIVSDIKVGRYRSSGGRERPGERTEGATRMAQLPDMRECVLGENLSAAAQSPADTTGAKVETQRAPACPFEDSFVTAIDIIKSSGRDDGDRASGLVQRLRLLDDARVRTERTGCHDADALPLSHPMRAKFGRCAGPADPW